ncbi:MAG: GH36-type glycosyl hydrolase domain-containing protein [Pseudanabaena sp.]|nr:glycosyl transferase family 36 [Pseudanabaena sp. M090S1SP2A07QC]MCA6504993.1 glycosyl transferase family 36 [Pseudanabaena sp. M172S2SP2A07QC]MCA6520089.1 glycosyl transferase family 36 [Pseudanabaena sp. M110S1SP2A07QC]MCA6520789.1 glycosyl transferase family 36 [Pseudanabaena sp. M051S1SP2A07QC]MCA6525222.1 glycosyl transferase family 36 [Pseudanabaena sp. M179S2SP2A07QC]MCA6532418.1 glycosyl transferase family 36 [Pseudanabaena sp. M125S2SP2A07QC]MCA6537186.1 glycosyl transferase famil
MAIANQYGYYTEDNREFVITDPRTPRPWFNYMWNSQYAGLISHTGGGFSFLESPRDNRISRMRYNCLPWDRPGRYVMVKDTATGKYWSLSWSPTINLDYDFYECRHGQGYTKITTEINGIRGEITYFVPTDTNAEIWRVKLTELSGQARDLEVYSFLELLMGNALNDQINQPNDKHFTDIHFDKDLQALVATRRYWVLNKGVSVKQPNIDWKYQIYFSQSLPIAGFDSSLDTFIGRWRSEANPVAVETGVMQNTEITAGDPVVALQSKISLAANGSIDFAVVLEIVPKEIPPTPLVKGGNIVEIVDSKFLQLKQKWDQHLSCVQVQTPDAAFNAMLNVWNQYQSAVTFDMARNSGYYHGGLLFGTGMRDRFQDILGVVMVDPARVRERLIKALNFQFKDGSTLHNYFVLTNTGERTNHSDTPLWIPFGIVEYLKETGDFSILDEVVPYHDESSGTVYEHLIRALDFAIANTGEKGMPRIFTGDWNDTLDHVGSQGKGETTWGAFFLGYVLNKSLPVCEHQGDRKSLEKFQNFYEHLRQVTNDICWDGDWYLRAFRDNGEPIGVSTATQGKIFLNAQSWAVISELAPKDRADKAMASSREHLATPFGMQIVAPSFTEIDDTVGLISRCVPGKKENGAVFNHASAWFVLASLLNGDTEFGWEIYCRMMPINSSQATDAKCDRFETEPYVYPEYVTSPDHETQGQASHSWLTGTAVWMLRIGLDYILGFQPTFTGMIIDPKIPAEWSGFTAKRKFRGKVLSLTVVNHSEVKQMTVNGQVVEGNFIDLALYASNEIAIAVNL